MVRCLCPSWCNRLLLDGIYEVAEIPCTFCCFAIVFHVWFKEVGNLSLILYNKFHIFWTKIFLIVFEFHQIIYTSSLYRLIFRPLQIFLDCCSKKLFKKILQIYTESKLDLLECASGKNLSCASKFHLMKVETMIYFVHCHANSWISWLCFLQFQVYF